MKRILIDVIQVIIAALLALAGFTVFSIIIAAAVNDADDPTVQNILLAVICTAAFVISMLYVRKIRNEAGEEEMSRDYKNESYRSVKADLRTVLSHEKWVLIAVCAISLICCVVNICWYGVLGNTIASPISFSMIAMTAFQLFFPFDSAGPILFVLGYLISIAVDIAAYIGVLLIYRNRLSEHL